MTRGLSISSAYLRVVKVPFRMICMSVCPLMHILPHTVQPACLYCDLSRTNVGLFQVPLSLHAKAFRVSHSRLNHDSSVNSTWLQFCCSKSWYSPAHLLRAARGLEVNGIKITAQRAERPPWWSLLSIVRLDALCPVAKSNYLYSCVALSVLFRWAVNSIYRSSVAVVARDWLWPRRRQTFTVSWNRFHSLATTLLTTPIASTILRCVRPDSSLPIIHHVMDSGKSHCWDISNHLFWKTINEQ